LACDFSDFISTNSARWTQMQNPTAFSDMCGATGSGRGFFVVTKPVANEYLVFFSDSGVVAVASGRPMVVGFKEIHG
jgi:hypothetical protein